MSNIKVKSNFTYDPYAILQVESRASLDEVKMAYKTLGKVFHPDRPTGHPEMFRMINEAYQQILKQYQDRSQTVKDLQKARADLKVTERGSINQKNFNVQKFNEQFLQHRDPKRDNVYDVDHNSYQERTYSSYQSERSQINQELEKMKPLFNRGQGFNPNVFNRLFENLKRNNQDNCRQLTTSNVISEQFYNLGLGLVDQVQLGTDQQLALIPHQQNLTSHSSELLSYQQPAPENFYNPSSLTNDQYDYFSQQPDVSQVGAMSKEEAKRRLAEYQAQQITIPPVGPHPKQAMNIRDQMSGPALPTNNQPIRFLTYPASSQTVDNQWTGNLENTHPSYLANQLPQNQFLPIDQFPNNDQTPTNLPSNNYDQLANLRDYYQKRSIENDASAPSEQQPILDPDDFYEAPTSFSESTSVIPQSVNTNSSADHNTITEMAVELQRLKQQMAVQDRLLRKMHRRNKQMVSNKNMVS